METGEELFRYRFNEPARACKCVEQCWLGWLGAMLAWERYWRVLW